MTMPNMFGRYEIHREIGRGGFATVYQATDSNLGRPIALKVLNDSGLNAERLARFRAEARISSQLSHPNIVVVHDAGELDGKFFIAMQFVDGQNLGEVMKASGRALMPFERIDAILSGVGSALDYANGMGAVHRDINPSNILIDRAGKAFLTDFGIVKVLGAETTTGLTVVGQVVGTPYYFSPEQANGLPLDGRSDLYSLAVVIYQLCAGRVPFDADTPPTLVHSIVYDPPPPPETVHPRVVKPIAPVLLKALAKKAEDRYPTGVAFAAAFAAAVKAAQEKMLRGRLQAARRLAEQKDFDGAEKLLREALTFDPSSSELASALERLEQDRLEYLLDLAARRFASGDFGVAEKSAEQALALSPGLAAAERILKEARSARDWDRRCASFETHCGSLRAEARALLDSGPSSSKPRPWLVLLGGGVEPPSRKGVHWGPEKADIALTIGQPILARLLALCVVLAIGSGVIALVLAVNTPPVLLSAGTWQDYVLINSVFLKNLVIGPVTGLAALVAIPGFVSALVLRAGVNRRTS